MNPTSEIKEALKRSLTPLVEEDFDLDNVVLQHPNELAHGDFATNVAMRLAKPLKKAPLKIAEELVEVLKKDKALSKLVTKIEAVKPGFINFTLNNKFLLSEVGVILKQGDKYGSAKLGKGKKVLIEYSQMNVAKPIHVGHLRTMFIGDSLKRIYKFLGYKVISDTHYGDWGVQFGMVLYAYKKWGDEKKVKEDPVGELVRLYIEMGKKIEKDPDLREDAKAEFKKLEDGDKENKKLWKWFVEASIKKFDEMYELLDILPFEHHLSESYYEDKMQAELDELLKKKIAVQEDKLIYVDLEEYKLGHCIMQKSDGATTYHLRDMATYRHRLKKLKVDQNLYVVDVRQSHHFKQLFKVAELLGWSGLAGTKHVSYGFVSLPDGGLSTRKGRVVQAYDVVTQGIKKAKQVIVEKNPELANQDQVALEVTRAALKFANLVANRNSDIIFDWDSVLSFEGDTGPYLQYTYARIQSLFRKAGQQGGQDTPGNTELNKFESELLRTLYRFPEAVQLAHDENDPHAIAEYLLDLSHRFNSFYGNTRIVDVESGREVRLAISGAVAQVLKTGLGLLGISVVNEM